MATDLNQLLANPEMLGYERQRQMAQALLKQGMTSPQGQMIGDRYVPANPMQYIGNLFNVYAGQKGLETTDQQELAMAKALRQQDMADLQAGMDLYQGTKEKFTELAGPYVRDSGLKGADVMPMAYMPEQAANPQAAMAKLLGSTGPKSSALGGKLLEQMFKQPKWEKTSIKENGQEVFGVYDANNPNVRSTFVPYNTSPDIPYLNAEYSGVLRGNTPNATPGASTGTATTPVSVRNNNPGNLMENGKFLSFSTPEAGDAALINDLSLKLSGQSPAYKARFGNAPVTPLTLAETWSPASAKGNSPDSTANYSKFIADTLGIAPNQPIPNTPQALQAVKSAITKFEAGAYDGQTPKAKIEASKYDLQPPANFQSRKEQDEWFAKAREPLTGEMAKKASGAVTTLRALDEYKALVDNYSKAQFLSPDDRAILTKAHAQLMLQLKDANGLGVLNKGDLPMLEKLIVNPNNLGSLILSKTVLENQVTEQKAFMRDVIKNTYLDNGKQIPESVKQKLVALDQELEAAKAAKPSKTTASTPSSGSWGKATVVK
jgi:hypothetical protein